MAECNSSLVDDLQTAAGRAASLLHSLQTARAQEIKYVAEIASLREAVLAGERRECALKADAVELSTQLASVKAQLQRQQDDVESKFKKHWRGSLSFLGALELPTFASVSKSFAELLNDDTIWRDVVGTSGLPLLQHNHKAALIAQERNKQVLKLKDAQATALLAMTNVSKSFLEVTNTLKKSQSDLRIAELMQDYYRNECKKYIVKWTITPSALAAVGWRESMTSPDFSIRGVDGRFELYPWGSGNKQSRRGCSSLFVHIDDDDVTIQVRVFFDDDYFNTLNWQYKSGAKKKAGGWAIAPPVDMSGVTIQAEFEVVHRKIDDVVVYL